MAEQNYSNHTRMVTGYHYIGSALWVALFIGSLVNLFHSTPETHYSAALIVVMNILIVMVAYYTRAFALKAQDRAIRAEEKLRYFILAHWRKCSAQADHLLPVRFARIASGFFIPLLLIN